MTSLQKQEQKLLGIFFLKLLTKIKPTPMLLLEVYGLGSTWGTMLVPWLSLTR